MARLKPQSFGEIKRRLEAAGFVEAPRADTMGAEVSMPDPADVFKSALSLNVQDRAALAQRLLASLEELSEEEADRLWADEAQRRLEGYRAGRAKAVPAADVARKAERLFR